jgi:LPS-assembly lipoprotein
MWWPRTLSLATRAAVVAALSLSVAGCFRPLYGPTASGQNLQGMLASIDVAEVAVPPPYERVGHYLRNELIFDLNGSGIPQPKRYKLALSFTQGVRTPIVESTTGRAQSATLVGTVNYTLTALDGNKVVANGVATSYATYDRTPQRFATVRAARDADIRIAKDLSDQIRTRLAVALSSAS